MKIQANQDLRVFSHNPGVSVLLPKTLMEVQVFPLRLEFKPLGDLKTVLALDFDLLGEVKNFTVFQDLKEGLIEVQGFSLNGFFRYRLFLSADGINLQILKAPKKLIVHLQEGQDRLNCRPIKFELKKPFLLPLNSPFEKVEGSFGFLPKKSFELLFLGMHKKLDIDLMKRRHDLKELLPLWLRLGQITPKLSFDENGLTEGNLKLLQELERAVLEKEKKKAEELLLMIFKTAFKGLFVPRLFDEQYQGILKSDDFAKGFNMQNQPDSNKINDPIAASLLLSYGADLIRSLFFQEKENNFYILPVSSIFSGRFVNLETQFGLLQIEWTKKLLKKMILKATKTVRLHLHLQRKISSFRMRLDKKSKGKVFECETPLLIEEGKIYLFDRFQK